MLYGEGLSRARELNTSIGDWLGIRGDAYRGLGRCGEAVESLKQALPAFEAHFMRRHEGLCLLKLGYAYQGMGDHDTAVTHLSESLAIFSQLQLDHYTELVQRALSELCSTARS
jgi:tetratricopeptide (TPR) repeat protein